MLNYGNFATRRAAVAAMRRRDLDCAVVVEGKGTAAKPWAVLDVGAAHDLLETDVGRQAAAALLRPGVAVVTIAQYHR